MKGGVSNIIEFADPAVEALCLKKWDNNKDGYLMRIEAAGVSGIQGVFVNKGGLTKFKEFQYFTGITTLKFFSANGYGTFHSVGFTVLGLPSSITTIQEKSIVSCKSLVSLLCMGTTPATLEGSPFSSTYVSADLLIYVPDTSVDAYKNAWSEYADKIKPLSEYVE